MRRATRRRNIIGALAALAVGGVALYLGGGWGIVVVEGAAALAVVVMFLCRMNEGGNGDAAR